MEFSLGRLSASAGDSPEPPKKVDYRRLFRGSAQIFNVKFFRGRSHAVYTYRRTQRGSSNCAIIPALDVFIQALFIKSIAQALNASANHRKTPASGMTLV